MTRCQKAFENIAAGRSLMALLVLLCAPSVALACDCVSWLPGPHFEEGIDRVITGSSAIIEGEIARAMTSDGQPVAVRASHVWKGPNQREFKVGLVSDCSTVLDKKMVRPGQPIRLILLGGPKIYEANRCTNFQGTMFNRAIDMRLKKLQAK